jgi:ribosome-associated protein
MIALHEQDHDFSLASCSVKIRPNHFNCQMIKERVHEILADTKAEAITTYHLGGKHPLFDDVVVCTALSTRHVQSLSDAVRRGVKKQLKVKIEGEKDQQWMLVDLNRLIVHIMTDTKRQHYQIDALLESMCAADS